MRKIIFSTLLLAAGIACTASPVAALQVVVTHIDKNGDGTATYHFAVQTDPGETLTPGDDFVTVYNFGTLVDGSAKSPSGWGFSSDEYGRTPTWNGYPAVMPVDVAGLNNLTWTAKRPVSGGATVDGFSATTRSAGTTEGEYSAQVTRTGHGKATKQAIIGQLTTPAFLAQ
ncbi:MAG TPA: hypothetical protein VGK90_01785 [Rhizomicrobium sp.]|jgi:hypothetical protein